MNARCALGSAGNVYTHPGIFDDWWYLYFWKDGRKRRAKGTRARISRVMADETAERANWSWKQEAAWKPMKAKICFNVMKK